MPRKKKQKFFVGDYVHCRGLDDSNYYVYQVDKKNDKAFLESCRHFGSNAGWKPCKDLKHVVLPKVISAEFCIERIRELAQALDYALQERMTKKKQGLLAEWVLYHINRSISGMYGDPRLERLAKGLTTLADDWMHYTDALSLKPKKKKR